MALAIHTYACRPGKPADLSYLRLVLITEVLPSCFLDNRTPTFVA